MQKVYIAVTLIFLLCIILFISSFFYLDKENHKVYYYVISVGGHDIGTVRIDKFNTEDKLIYKSASNTPFLPLVEESRSRITLDKKYRLESYSKEIYANKTTDLIYAENKNSLISSLTRLGSKFIYSENVPIKRDAFIFEEDSPVTYLPIIENYNFKRGRFQGFNTLTYFQDLLLPPMKRFVILTSIRDEFLKIDSYKIKTENLILKIRNYPQFSIWVAKSDRSLVKIEMPDRNLKITRTFFPKTLEAKEYNLTADTYVSKEVTFKNKEVQLSGAISLPKTEGKFPAVILVAGSGPQDRGYQGLFLSIADYLSRNGFCVLRYDKRGVGASDGDSFANNDSDMAGDVKAALEYLSSQNEVDTNRIVILGHMKGAFYAAKAASEEAGVKGLILMSPSLYPSLGNTFNLESLNTITVTSRWGEDYAKLVSKSIDDTAEKVKNAKRSWAYILGKKCFLDATREELSENPMDAFKNIKIPVFILQGKEARYSSSDFADKVDKTLEENGNLHHMLTYYSYLGDFLGKLINDGSHKMYYEVDKEVLENIKSWINKIFEAPAEPKIS